MLKFWFLKNFPYYPIIFLENSTKDLEFLNFQNHNFFFKKNFQYKYPKIVISFRERDQLTEVRYFVPEFKRPPMSL